MAQFDTAIVKKTLITPEIAQKMVIDQYKKITCRKCGTVSQLGDIQPAMFIEKIDTGRFRPPAMGGNGWNFHCPQCKETI
jgi:hypothetical protein